MNPFKPQIRRAVGHLVVVLVLTAQAFAANPESFPDNYSLQDWFVEKGLPSDKVRALTQDRDGYLWLATAHGIARFDGIRFTNFSPDRNSGMMGDGFFAAQAMPDGTVWFGGDRGLFHRHDGRFDLFTTADGLPSNQIRFLAVAGDGALVIGSANGFCFLRGGRFVVPDRAWRQIKGIAHGYLERPDGSILVGSENGLWRIEGASARRLFPGDHTDVAYSSIVEAPDGSVWIGYGHGLRLLRPDGTIKDFGRAEGIEVPRVTALLLDRAGNLWIGTHGGLCCLPKGAQRAVAYPDGFAGRVVQQVMEDREGSLWFACSTGLYHLRRSVCSTLGTAAGLTQTSVISVMESGDGAWWIGLWDGGMYRYDQVRAQHFDTPGPLSPNPIRALAEMPAGTLWIGTRSGLYRKSGAALVEINREVAPDLGWQSESDPSKPLVPDVSHGQVNGFAADGDGGLWIATDGALYHTTAAGRTRAYRRRDGLPGENVKSVLMARDGSVWAACPPQGVARFQGGRWTSFYCGRELSGIYPRTVYEDLRGTLWVATEGGGLDRFKDGKWRTLTTADGLVDNYITSMVDDAIGNLWVACPVGIMRIPHAQLDELDAGRRSVLEPHVFTRFDGLPEGDFSIKGEPGAWRTRDGRLLFANDAGVGVIDPGRLSFNTQAPPVRIERLVINGRDADLKGPIEVPPGANEVLVDYTALSLVAPEKVRFKIALLPRDRGWVDAGNHRDVRYYALPPGSYSFRATACNDDGLWNETGASLNFTVRPFFYETRWFAALLTALAGAAAYGAYSLRVRWVRRQMRQLEILVDKRTVALKAALAARENLQQELVLAIGSRERNAIGRELHDGLCQQLTGTAYIAQRLADILTQADNPTYAESARRIVNLIQEGIAQSRQLARGLLLSSIEPSAFVAELAEMAEATQTVDGILCQLYAKGAPQPPDAATAAQLFRIAQEAVRNAVRHARCRRIAIRLSGENGVLQLSVTDDGTGLPPPEQQGAGMGIQIMAQRAESIKARFSVESIPGGGTRVNCSLTKDRPVI